MKVYDAKNIRNIALLGHGAAGKTTLAEAALYTSGAIGRMGKIENGNTKSDYLEDETNRQISISTSLMQFEWGQCKINLIDTPGYADFVGEVICGISAIDSVMILVDAVTGLEVGTETSWGICEKNKTPRILVINRTGKEHAATDDVLKSIQERFGIRALPIQIPVNPGIGFNKIVDFVSMKEYTYDVDGNGKGKAGDISDDM
ncbi:MAG TPA: GTP-binding protein, partial [Anaerolineae bacterium]|nr:GTP-binding protein [Anaerolineae bacterium]